MPHIVKELKEHIPFTAIGALSGLVIMGVIVYGDLLSSVGSYSYGIFFILHPAHVLLSAMVTTTIYLRYGKGPVWLAVCIGFVGSIGIATISDSIIPYIGELLLELPHSEAHIGIIEEPLATIPPAFIGIGISFWGTSTHFPHFGHVLISTWASLFHVIMALGETVSGIQMFVIFVFLFLAVWLPCCVSDIMFPLLFVDEEERDKVECHCHTCVDECVDEP